VRQLSSTFTGVVMRLHVDSVGDFANCLSAAHLAFDQRSWLLTASRKATYTVLRRLPRVCPSTKVVATLLQIPWLSISYISFIVLRTLAFRTFSPFILFLCFTCNLRVYTYILWPPIHAWLIFKESNKNVSENNRSISRPNIGPIS